MSDRIIRKDGKVVYIDRVLPDGPWNDEPDHVDFEAEGFPCILHRSPLGAWCGYVGVPPGHPWHGKGYDDVRIAGDEWPEVHGGLTYADACQGSICHVAKPGEPDDVWWLGFDCAHCGDRSLSDEYFALTRPGLFGNSGHDQYRTVGYVRHQTEKLARQAKESQ